MMPDHLVGTNSTCTPMSWAMRLATSISKPMYSPFLSFMAHGTKVSKPTRSTPRSMIWSSTLFSGAAGLGAGKRPAHRLKANNMMAINLDMSPPNGMTVHVFPEALPAMTGRP